MQQASSLFHGLAVKGLEINNKQRQKWVAHQGVWRKIKQKEDEESCFEERVRYGLPGKGSFEQRPEGAT